MAELERPDRYKWKEAQAIYVDNFEVSVIPDAQIVRIAFGEYGGPGTPFLRLAIAMPIEDARSLVRILGDLLEKADREEEEEHPSNV